MSEQSTEEPKAGDVVMPEWHRTIATLVCEYDKALRTGGLWDDNHIFALVEKFHAYLLIAYCDTIEKWLDPPMTMKFDEVARRLLEKP